MNQEELKKMINESPERFFEKDKSGKGYVCKLCGSGTGKHGTGMTAKRMSDGRIILTCWKCGESGDVIHWLEKIKGMSYKEVLEYVEKEWGIKQNQNFSSYEQKNKILRTESAEEELAEADYNNFYEESAKRLTETDYWAKRGLSLNNCQKFGLGFVTKWRHPKAPPTVPYSPRLIIPVSKQGYLARDVRSEVPEGEKEYSKSKVGKISIFNLKALKEKIVYVVEGEIDAISLSEIGVSAVGLGSIAYKKKFIEEVKSSANKPGIMIIALDNEKNVKTAQTVKKVGEYLEEELKNLGIFVLVAKNLYGKYKDANEALVADRVALQKSVEEVQKLAVGMKERNSVDKIRSVEKYLKEAMFQKDVSEYQRCVNRVTGYKNLDEQGKLYPGLYVLGAVTGLGKTTFMHQMSGQLVERGENVLYISYEQTMFELVSKGLSRLTYESKSRFSAIDIRRGAKSSSIDEAMKKYMANGKREYIYEAQFDDSVDVIIAEVEKMVMQGLNPVVIIDYLQVIAPSESKGKRLTTKESIDETVKKLKSLQRKYGLVMFLISALNRQNYLSLIDFESFKESGGIEYTADVVWGLQFAVMRNDVFNKATELNKKRELVKKARSANPRQVELVCLKSRYSAPGYSCYFNYYPAYDYFEPCEEKDIKLNLTGMVTKEDEDIIS